MELVSEKPTVGAASTTAIPDALTRALLNPYEAREAKGRLMHIIALSE